MEFTASGDDWCLEVRAIQNIILDLREVKELQNEVYTKQLLKSCLPLC